MVAVTAALQLGGAALSAFGSSQAAKSAGKAQSAAAKAAAESVSHAKETQQFYQRQHTRNQALYGRLERNRVRALEKITPDKIQSQSLQRLNKSRQSIINRIKESAAARGIQTSGLTDDQILQTEYKFAEADAQTRLDAEKQAIDILTGGIQPGLNREAQLNQNIGQASGQVVSAYGTQAQTQLNIAGQQQNKASSLGSAAGLLSGLAGGSEGAPKFADLVSQLGGGS